MPREIKTLIALIFFCLIITACDQETQIQRTIEPVSSTPDITIEPNITNEAVDSPADTATLTAAPNDYGDCGPGKLIEVPYFFQDENGLNSPTQVVRFQTTSDNIRRHVSVISCLMHDEGWLSNPDEVENGYENEIVLFDKHGKGHVYRIIIGGHYITPHDPQHKDLTSSLNGVDTHFYYVDDWIKITQAHFSSTGTRQIGVDIYLEDTKGNLSNVLSQVYQFKETNLQIEAALKTGDGYPEQVPDGFFLFATESWLVFTE